MTSSVGRLLRNPFARALLLTILVMGFSAWLHPVIGVRDGDAFNYVIGAHSIQAGAGFVSAGGRPLGHWAPGYAFLLACFPDPLFGAWVINWLALGGVAGLLFLIARRNDWPTTAAAGLSGFLSAGFFRWLATTSTPDVLCYALFLAGLFLLMGEGKSRLAGFCLWAVLPLFKYVAALFVPIGSRVIRWNGRPMKRGWILAAIFLWGTVWIGLVGWNFWRGGGWLLEMQERPALAELTAYPVVFLKSIFRDLLGPWYGSVRSPLALGLSGGVAALALFALASLRPSERSRTWLILGGLILATLLGMSFVFTVYWGVRLSGYGLFVILLSLRPSGRSSRWLLLALAMTIAGSVNALRSNSLGGNDPRYRAVAEEFRGGIEGLGDRELYTNAYGIFELHAGIPSHWTQAEADLSGIPVGGFFLWVNLPARFDSMAELVRPMPRPDSARFEELLRRPNAVLFRKARAG
ncbi:MAG: hypothetical protein COV76_01080 [Candidatus Omnitrophica bacterium CG11_big_fil_rev_8_21_14_0_20_64_10]|nr:MAG: hypothetical protein COV76_01080 [Candidatus Omnitrophica bacterium CG11_big_fil_rev_8_21_14_0_20_64_10]